MKNNINSYEELYQHLIDNKITMCKPFKFETVLRHFDKISNIKGDIVECGCWRGGFSIFMSHVFQNKNIWVSDSFEGFQPLEQAKYQYDKERHIPSYTMSPFGPLGISLEEVKFHFKNYGLENDSRINYLKGFVKDTLPKANINSISLLRIDVDAYSATLEVLEELYDKVENKGYIIFDDSSLYESLDAIKYFFEHKNIPPVLMDPITDKPLNIYSSHAPSNSGLPAGCYIVKNA